MSYAGANLTIRVSELSRELAIALKAVNTLNPPKDLVYVDANFANTLAPWQFSTVEQALLYIRAQKAISNVQWFMKVGKDSGGEPLKLPDNEDYYDLFDEGIIFVSDFDPFQNWKKFGGILDVSKMLYSVDISRQTQSYTL